MCVDKRQDESTDRRRSEEAVAGLGLPNPATKPVSHSASGAKRDDMANGENRLEALRRLLSNEILPTEAAALFTSHVEAAIAEGMTARQVLDFQWGAFGALSVTLHGAHDQLGPSQRASSTTRLTMSELVELLSEIERLPTVVVNSETAVSWKALQGFAKTMGAFLDQGEVLCRGLRARIPRSG